MPQRENSVSVSVPLTPTRSDLYWRRIFNKYDHDNDGRISYAELKGIIESREYEHDIPDAVVEKIMRLSDTDNSGYLEFAEFVEMMHRPELKALFGHYVARYVHCLIAPRSHVDTTGCPSDSTQGWTSPSTIFSTGSHRRSPLSVLQVSAAASSTPVHVPSQPLVSDRWSKLLYGDGRYEEQYSCWPPAICMVLVSLAEIATYAYDAAHGRTDARGPVANVLVYSPSKRHEAWRFLTYMFVHVGTVHILVNLLVQLFLGVPLEMVHRWWRVMLVYLAGVVAGSLATSLTDPRVYLAGASGGVYALIAAHIATIIMNWKQMDFAVVQLLVFILLAVVDIGTAVYNRYFLNLDENIGYVAHIAGACAGLLVGIGVLRNLEVNSWEKRLWWAAVVLYFVLMISAILANIFWTEHFKR